PLGSTSVVFSSLHPLKGWSLRETRGGSTSTPRWHHAEGAFLGGLPCIGIIEIPIQARLFSIASRYTYA
ncbi:hypothetical protein, partial [Pseudomonas amygdali]|uniref:hypothetical protein n=1 Tax=Pseudomonas amygdali TaxID=47877 RepID=UPI001F1EF5B6